MAEQVVRSILLAMFVAGASMAACNDAAERPISHVDLPGRPFEPIPTADGCWIFVSLIGNAARNQAGIAVVRRSEGKVALKRVASVAEALSGMTLTHDGKLLIAGTGNAVLFLDSERLISGKGEPIVGQLRTSSEKPSASYVSVTAADRFVFVSNESSGTISVINLEAAKQAGYASTAIVGTISTGRAPIAVTLSPDDRYLYSTSEIAPRSYGWPAACKPEQPNGGDRGLEWPEGALIVVDVNRAKTDPAHSVVSKTAAGCSPVRLVLAPKGDRAYVTARSDNAVLVFDTAKLVTDPEHARLGRIGVGEAPVGVAVVADGGKVIVANSNRFAGGQKNEKLSVIDAGKGIVTGTIPAGVFPRELRVTADNQTLLLTNFASKTLEWWTLTACPKRECEVY